MIVLDSLLIGGIRFVLDKVATAVEHEMNDEQRLREELLAAQMQLELGEIDDAGFQAREQVLLLRLREIRERERATGGAGAAAEGRVSGVETRVALGHDRG